MLQPFGRMMVPHGDKHQVINSLGDYLIDDGHGHCFAMCVLEGPYGGTMIFKKDTGDWERLDGTTAKGILRPKSVKVYKQIVVESAVHIAPFYLGCWTPPWVSDSEDRLLGGRSAKKPKPKVAGIKKDYHIKAQSWPHGLRSSLCKEARSVTTAVAKLKRDPDGWWACPMCPTKRFDRKNRVIHHLMCYHQQDPWRIDDSKVKVMVAGSWDAAVSQDRVAELFGLEAASSKHRLVQDCAAALRHDLMRSPSWDAQKKSVEKLYKNLDKHVVILLDMEDTRFILRSDATLFHCAGGKFFATDKFVNHFLAALVHPDTKGAAERVCTFLREPWCI